MIDWLTLRLFSLGHHVRAGAVMAVTADGEVEWSSPRRQVVEGSHASRVTLRHHTFDGSLEVSGNPAKWFQGHNIFGTDSIEPLAQAFALSVLDVAGIPLDDQSRSLISRGLIVISRVDVTESWDFGSRQRATAAVQGISEMGHLKHRGRGSLLAEGTCYFGKKSRRISAKAYAKGLELTKHPFSRELVHADELLDVAQGLVRVEWTLRAMWLKGRALDVVSNWGTKGVTPATLHGELMAGLNLSEAEMRDTTKCEGLAPRLQGIYSAWAEGVDVRAMFKSRATFYRYRSELLPLGIDIAVKRPREESNVIPLRVVLTGKPFEVPAWARGTPLYFEPEPLAA